MAVYTPITKEALVQYLAGFNIGSLVSFTGIVEGVENTNYKLVTDKGSFILTLFEKRTQPEDLPFFISFMEHLNHHGIPCPAVVADKHGINMVALAGKPAMITTFLDGAWPKKIETHHAAAVGKLLAGMHLAAKDFKQHRANAMALPAWKSLIEACGVENVFSELLAEELKFLEQFRPHDLPAGAVHADLFPDNVFFTGDKLSGVIDFYFSCTEVFAYDIMLTVNAWCFNTDGHLDTARYAAFMEAYEAARPLAKLEKMSRPYFGRAAAVRIIATRLYDSLHPAPGATVKAKDPLEYVRILKFYQAGKFPT